MSRSWIGAWGLCLGVGATGCVTTTRQLSPGLAPPPQSSASMDDVRQAEAADVGPVSADDAVSADASAARLHDIEGPLLMYYALHHRLPDRLEEIRPLADADTDLQLVAPSGQPYLYAPNGLGAPGTSKRIIVADPAPSPRTGARQCILMPPPPTTLGAPLSMEVLPVPEAAFKQFTPAP